jgi:hypothetical protein
MWPPAKVDWITSARSYPGQPRFTGIKTLVKVDSHVEHADRSTSETRYFICIARATRGHGAKNMAVLRRFALDLVRSKKTKGSVKTRRKRASWNPAFLLEILQVP